MQLHSVMLFFVQLPLRFSSHSLTVVKLLPRKAITSSMTSSIGRECSPVQSLDRPVGSRNGLKMCRLRLKTCSSSFRKGLGTFSLRVEHIANA